MRSRQAGDRQRAADTSCPCTADTSLGLSSQEYSGKRGVSRLFPVTDGTAELAQHRSPMSGAKEQVEGTLAQGSVEVVAADHSPAHPHPKLGKLSASF